MKARLVIILFLLFNYCCAQEPVEPVRPDPDFPLDFVQKSQRKFIDETNGKAHEWGYDIKANRGPLSFFKEKDGDELSLFFGKHISDIEIDKVNSISHLNLKHQTGKYDDCLLLSGKDFYKGRKGYLYQTTKSKSITNGDDLTEIIKLLPKYKRVIWAYKKGAIPEKIAEALSVNGVTLIERYASLVSKKDQKQMPFQVIVVSSKNAKKASEIFEGQDGGEISRITRHCSRFSHFKIVDNSHDLEQILSKNKNQRLFVIHHNRKDLNETISKYDVISITCKSFKNDFGKILSTNDLDFGSIVRAFEKSNLTSASLFDITAKVSKNYNIELKKKDRRAKALLSFFGSSLIGTIAWAIHFLFADLYIKSDNTIA